MQEILCLEARAKYYIRESRNTERKVKVRERMRLCVEGRAERGSVGHLPVRTGRILCAGSMCGSPG